MRWLKSAVTDQENVGLTLRCFGDALRVAFQTCEKTQHGVERWPPDRPGSTQEMGGHNDVLKG